jgi:hypothetical protein
VAGWVKLAEIGLARPSARMVLLSGYRKDDSYDHTWVPPGLQVADASLRLALILSQMTDITTSPPGDLEVHGAHNNTVQISDGGMVLQSFFNFHNSA